MRIDLHTHSNASDGTDTPAELMAAAAAAGLDVIGITDHDTTAGWARAQENLPAGLRLIRGAEFSTQLPWHGRTVSVHLLGYLFDPYAPGIVAEERRLRGERRRRGLAIVQRMAAAGIPVSAERVLAIADGAPIGRPHIGRALVEAGVVSTVSEAFDTYLSTRAPYYVPKADTDLRAAIQMITDAGGVSVIAHPRGRGAHRVLDEARLAELAGLGLAGLEVNHPDHDAEQRAELTRIAHEMGLIVTGSSDYHGHNKALTLGQQTTDPQALEAIVERAASGVLPVGERR